MGKRYETHFDPETRVFTKTFNDPDNTKLTIDLNHVPDVSQQYVESYGITQIANDCHAGAKSISEMIAATKQKLDDLAQGVLRRRGTGMGIGIDVEQLTQAVANVLFNGDLDQAKAKIDPFIPDLENDSEELVKAKKARLRAIRNMGEIKMEIDKLKGKDTGSLLDAPVTVEEEDEAAA